MTFRRVTFHLLERIIGWDPQKAVVTDKGIQQRWQLFKDTLLRAQELSILSIRNQIDKAGNWHGSTRN